MSNIVYVGKHLLTTTVNRHAHSSWELVYCTGGSGLFRFDGMDLPYKEGDVVVIPPFVPHSNFSEKGFTNIHMNMTGTVFPGKIPALISDDNNRFIYQVFNAAFFHFSGTPERKRMLLDACGELICGYLMAYRNAKPLSHVVEEIENNIIENFQDASYALDEYLQSLPFSGDYLRKLFRREMGITPHQYLSDKRLQTAAHMLAYGYSENVSEIAQLCGFREPLYFSRMFKKKYGVAPSYYAQHGRDAADQTDPDSMKIML